jgi:NAD(P)H-hydrate epimerase
MVFKWMKMIDLPNDLRSLDRKQLFDDSLKHAASILKDYDPFVHKGNRGHLGLIAGSEGMAGAAILSAMAANKSGLGKLTVHIPGRYQLLFHQTIPEAMVKGQEEELICSPFNALAIGPGLGLSHTSQKLLESAISSQKPLLLDADALTILSRNPAYFNELPPSSLLTPHLGEWERLFGSSHNDKSRISTSIDICNKHNINILMKGHVSVLITADGNFHLNGSGNAGMAKAGSGDVLTGLLGGLLAQGYSVAETGILGMFIHGMAGDIAQAALGSDFMTATDQIQCLSGAFKRLRNSRTNP